MLFHAINFKAQHECCLWRCICKTWNWICEWFIFANHRQLHHFASCTQTRAIQWRQTHFCVCWTHKTKFVSPTHRKYIGSIRWFVHLICSMYFFSLLIYFDFILEIYLERRAFFWFSSGLNVLLALVCVCRTSFSINTEIYRFFSSLCTVKLGL